MNRKKILLVEDEEHLLKTIQLNLELEEYAVITAVTGFEALKIFQHRMDMTQRQPHDERDYRSYKPTEVELMNTQSSATIRSTVA